jgi:hypothetical protein
VGALTAHWEPAPMTDPLITADLDLPLDVLLNLTPQVTFDLIIRLDESTNL